MFDLHGKYAVVTGAARGIGKAAACALAAAGADVLAVDRLTEPLDATVKEFCDAGHQATSLTTDIATARGLAALRSAVADAGVPPAVVVTAAGIMRRRDPLDFSLDDLNDLWRVNVVGTVGVIQSLLPAMAEAGYGKVITVGSLGSVRGLERRTGYATTKGAVAQYTVSLASEMGRAGIRANSVAPGYVTTDMASEYIYQDPETTRMLADRIPLGRFAAPTDLAGTFLFLAAPASDYITGQIIVVDGGWTTT